MQAITAAGCTSSADNWDVRDPDPLEGYPRLRVNLVLTLVVGVLGGGLTLLGGVSAAVSARGALAIAVLTSLILGVVVGWVLFRRVGSFWSRLGATLIASTMIPLVDLLYFSAGPPVYYSVGAVVGATIMVLAIKALQPFMRQRLFHLQLQRSLLETVMMGAALVAFWWNVGMRDVTGSLLHPMLPFTLLACVLAALFVVAASREPDPGFRLAMSAAAGIAAIDPWAAWQVLQNEPPWFPRALDCFLWVLVAVGVMHGRIVEVTAEEETRLDRRRLQVVGVFTVATATPALAVILVHPPADAVTFTLIGIFLASMLAREVLRAHQIHTLTMQVLWKAGHDQLTGLGNRRALTEILAGDALPARCSLLLLDLDGFKAINDTRGHSVGDTVLVEVSRGLERLADHDELQIFRMGGDEFLIVAGGPPEDAERVAGDVVAKVEDVARAFPSLGEVRLSASVGVRHLDRSAEDDDLDAWARAGISAAGTAMQQAKARGKNRVVVYDQAMVADARRRREILQSLREVFGEPGSGQDQEDSSLRVLLHPVVRLDGGAVVALEAEPALQHPAHGLVHGEEITALCTEAGLSAALFLHTLELALEETAAARSGGVRLELRAGTAELTGSGFVDTVLGLLRRRDVSPGEVTLVFTTDPGGTVLRRFAAAGMLLMLDGVDGPGFLLRVSRLPVHGVRVAPGVVRSLSPHDLEAMLRGMAVMCARLDLALVVSGVDLPQHLEAARRAEADYAEGDLCGDRPYVVRPRSEPSI